MPWVYVIKNNQNNKYYVGQTVEDVRYRLNRHFSLSKKGEGYMLHAAIRKYGEHAFKLLEQIECEKSQLNEIERQTIIKYNSVQPNGYNILAYGSLANLEEGWWKGKERADSTKEKIAETKKTAYAEMTLEQQETLKEQGRQAYINLSTGEKARIQEQQRSWWANMTEEEKKVFVAGQAAKRVGHEVSKATRKKLSETHKSIGSSPVLTGAVEAARFVNTGSHHTEETKAKMSAAKKGKLKSKETRSNMTKAQHARRTPEQIERILNIRKMLSEGMSGIDIAKRIGCTPEYVYKVRKGERGKGI